MAASDGPLYDALGASIDYAGVGTAEQVNYQRMKELWLSVLGDVGKNQLLQPSSDFFQSGGNSLHPIKLQGEMKKQYKSDTKLSNMFQYSTLFQMARLMDEARRQVASES